MSWSGPREIKEPSPPNKKPGGKKLTKKGMALKKKVKEKQNNIADKSTDRFVFKMVSPNEFKKAISSLRKRDKFYVTDYSIKEYAKMSTYLFKPKSGEGFAGYAIKDGEMVSLFNSSKVSGVGLLGVKHAVTGGMVDRLECYGARLEALYKAKGFKRTSINKFNPEYANEYWNEKIHGRPDYITMALSK